MSLHSRKIALAIALGIIAIIVTGTAISFMGSRDRRPAVTIVTPLAPVTRSSTIIVPVSIEQTAVRDALERAAPRELSGKPDLPSLPFLDDADIGWSVSRGPFAVAGKPEGLSIS